MKFIIDQEAAERGEPFVREFERETSAEGCACKHRYAPECAWIVGRKVEPCACVCHQVEPSSPGDR